jgi:hypothetical protein
MKQQKFAIVEAIARQLFSDPEPFSWSPRKSKTRYLMDECVRTGDVSLPIETGVEAARSWALKRNNDVLPKLIWAQLHIQDAWNVRGSGYANTVSEKAWQGFHEELRKAESLLIELLKSEKPPLEAYALLLEVAKGEGWEEERLEPYLQRLEKTGANYFPPHAERVVMLMPRWGGEPRDSHAYALHIADAVGGDEGDMMYARLAMALQPYHSPVTCFEETQFDPERVFHGLELLIEDNPNDVNAGNAGARFAAGINDKSWARKFTERLMPLKKRGFDGSIFKDYQELETVAKWAVWPGNQPIFQRRENSTPPEKSPSEL